MYHAIRVGAGAAGAVVARELAEQNQKVLVDRALELAENL